jgi:endonuclease/exonuclease/phosphatase family metal-dependent hydrolase
MRYAGGTALLPLACLCPRLHFASASPQVLTQLKAVDADIIALQEVDVGCDRSRGVDTGAHLAAALEMNYL